MEEAQRIYGDRDDLVARRHQARRRCDGADALVDRDRVEGVPRARLRRASARSSQAPVIFDGRNLYDPARLARRGFAYYAIGRGA